MLKETEERGAVEGQIGGLFYGKPGNRCRTALDLASSKGRTKIMTRLERSFSLAFPVLSACV